MPHRSRDGALTDLEHRGPVADSLATALEVADQAGPSAEPLAEFARAAFVHGSGQATLALAALTATGAIVLAVFAPGRTSPARTTSIVRAPRDRRIEK